LQKVSLTWIAAIVQAPVEDRTPRSLTNVAIGVTRQGADGGDVICRSD